MPVFAGRNAVFLLLLRERELYIMKKKFPAAKGRIKKEDVITSAQLEKAIDISQLSTAEENLKMVMEALLSPVLENAGYTLVWQAET